MRVRESIAFAQVSSLCTGMGSAVRLGSEM